MDEGVLKYISIFRFLLNKDPVTLTKTFTDNKLKCASPTTKFSDEHNASPRFDNSVMYPLTLSSTKKNYSPVHNNSGDVNHTSQFNVSETDGVHRQPSVGSVSIPSPSPDDMAPQCISFIGNGFTLCDSIPCILSWLFF